MRTRRLTAMVVAGMIATLGLVSGPVTAGPAGAVSCAVGTWTLTNASASRTINTRYGRLTVAPIAGGSVELVIGATGTWQLAVDQSFQATGSGTLGTASGTVDLHATASGTYRLKTNGALVVRTAAIAGDANFVGTVNGFPLSYAYTLVKSDVGQYFGIKGKGVPTCTAGPGLTLRFRTVNLAFTA
ncbi:MAG: hypothetical protein ACXV9P_09860 [Acidimicrobiia bacterium]